MFWNSEENAMRMCLLILVVKEPEQMDFDAINLLKKEKKKWWSDWRRMEQGIKVNKNTRVCGCLWTNE